MKNEKRVLVFVSLLFIIVGIAILAARIVIASEISARFFQVVMFQQEEENEEIEEEDEEEDEKDEDDEKEDAEDSLQSEKILHVPYGTDSNNAKKYIAGTKYIGTHELGPTTYQWSDDRKSCVATRKCIYDNQCTYSESSQGTVTYKITKKPSCVKTGKIKYKAVFPDDWANSQTKTESLPALGHNMGETQYEWVEPVEPAIMLMALEPEKEESEKEEGKKQYVAYRSCQNEGCTYMERALPIKITSEVTKPPTCTEMGETTYTFRFGIDWAPIRFEILRDIPALGHDWSEEWAGDEESHWHECQRCHEKKDISKHKWSAVSYSFSDDYSVCYATKTCRHCKKKITVESKVTKQILKESTCSSEGDVEYIANFDVPWAEAQESIEIGGIPISENIHEWGKVEYIWSSDNKSCIAKRVCKFNPEHFEEVTGTVSETEKIAATCTEKGLVEYTAVFNVNWASKQTISRETKELGHDMIWNADGDYHWHICTRCGEQQESEKEMHLFEVHDDGKMHCKKCGAECEIDKNFAKVSDIPVELTVAAHNFSVTVPTSLPINVAADGTITYSDASSCRIVNNEEGPVEISAIALSGVNGWEIVPISTAMESETVNTKKLAMIVMGYGTNDGGLDTTAFQAQTIKGNGNFGIVYTAKLPAQTIEFDKTPIANVVFTIDWHKAA